MDATFTLGKLIKYSPKSDAIFTKHSGLSPKMFGFTILCPTRWTVRANGLLSVMNTLHYNTQSMGLIS